MTKVDKEVVYRWLSEAREALDEMKSLLSMDVASFINDRRSRYSLRYVVVLVVEALADIAIAILEKDFDTVVQTYREAFLKLAEKGIVNVDTAKAMAKLASLRNIIVHRYCAIDDLKISETAKGSGISVVEKFMQEVVRYIEAKDP